MNDFVSGSNRCPSDCKSERKTNDLALKCIRRYKHSNVSAHAR